MKKQILLLIAIIVSLTSYGQDAKLIAKAEAGDAESQYCLALKYWSGSNGFPKDDSKYAYWVTKAAEGGHPEAQDDLAHNYGYGSDGFPKDDSKYVYWLTKAAEGGNPEAQYHLGDYYSKGEHGLPEDVGRFLKWTKKSAYNNHISACYSLGLYYEDKNKQEAIYWFKKAADIYFKEYGKENEYYAEALHKLGVYYNPGEKDSYASSSSNGASSSHSSSSSRRNGSSAADAPLMTPVQVWNPCFMCGGTGLCTSCQGKGKDWYGNSYQLCVTCHGNMYCQKCFGRKGYYTTEYR